jgi:prepilin-type N-terminal cleavage/methylation domain-containing protein
MMINREKYFNQGFTIIELMVVMSVFIIVLLITAGTFNTILTKTRVIFGSEESNIEGIVGLEMLRHDLQQAGFGLITDGDSVPAYSEAGNAPYSVYNDTPNKVPRALVTDNELKIDNSAPGSNVTADYIVIKGTTVGRTKASQRWTYITDSGLPKRWGSNDFEDRSDKLVAVEQAYDKANNQISRRLVRKSGNDYAFSYYASGAFRDQSGSPASNYYTPTGSDRYYLYGITSDSDTNFALRAPFNRTDYFVRRTNGSIPSSCSTSTGVLYKATMNHDNSGSFNMIPILDCVADMQIVLGWTTASDPENHPEANIFTDADGSTVSDTSQLNGLSISNIMGSAKQVRRRLRLIKVYILVQDGGRDLNFTNTNSAMVVGDPGLASLTKTVDLTKDDDVDGHYLHYRWELYRIVVKPKNL